MTINNAIIREYAFAGACLLSSMQINGLTSIPAHCFENNNNIQSIVIEHDNSPLTIGASAFYNCGDEDEGLTNCIISSATQPTYIKEAAFAETASLTSLNLHNVKEIGISAFAKSGLANDGIGESYDIAFPSTLLSIGKFAFDSCNMT